MIIYISLRYLWVLLIFLCPFFEIHPQEKIPKMNLIDEIQINESKDFITNLNICQTYYIREGFLYPKNSVTDKLNTQLNLSDIPRGVNTLILAPDKKSFIVFEEKENETDYIYFFDSSGKQINKQLLNIYPKVRYSDNGLFVEVINMFGNHFFVFKPDGNLLYNLDYTELIQNVEPILNNIHMIDDKRVLLNIDNKIQLINVDENTAKWVFQCGKTINCSVINKGNYMCVIAYSQDINTKTNKPYENLYILSTNNGELIYQVTNRDKMYLVGNKIYDIENSVVKVYVVE